MKSRLSDRANKVIVIVLALLMTGVIVANAMTLMKVSIQQTDEIGSDRAIQIRDDLQLVLAQARNSIDHFSYELEMEMLKDESEAHIRPFIEMKMKEYAGDNAVLLTSYAIGEKWTIIPNYNGESSYDPESRDWYIDLMSNEEDVAISSTYLDLATNQMCFTISKRLGDGKTVVAQDYSLADVQEGIRTLQDTASGDALIVDDSETIVGYTDETYIGKKLSEALPQYESALHMAEKIQEECESFSMQINGIQSTVFCTKTNNEWYLIYNVNSTELYKDTYMQMVRNTLLFAALAISIIVLYLNSNKNRKRAEMALQQKEAFLDSISNNFQEPLQNIIHSSNYDLFVQAENQKGIMDSIRESSLRLSVMMNNLFSYSNIIGEDKKESVDLDRTQKRFLMGIALTIAVTVIGVLGVSINSSMRLADSTMQEEASEYTTLIKQWMTEQEAVVNTIANGLAADSKVLEDYDASVTLLNEIACKYNEISVLYITNPEWGNGGVIMNNGWEPDETFVLEDRIWYVSTFHSRNGQSISDPYYDAQTGLYCITISKIVYDKNGKFIGVVGADFYLDKLIDILGKNYSNSGYAFLVDGHGTIINHPHAPYELKEDFSTNIKNSEYRELPNKGTPMVIEDYDRNYRVAVKIQEEISDFSIIVVKDFFVIYGAMITRIALLAVVFIVCVSLILWLMRRLTSWQAKTKKELEMAVESAVSANKSQAQFFAQMSHEIRTPINAVLGMNEMILRESDDPAILDYAQNIDSAGNTLLSIINNLLDFSKISDGKMEVNAVTYDTAAVIRKLVHMIDEKAKAKGLEFRLEVDEQLPAKLFGDDVKLTQVITNLLSNALKYTPTGCITLRIQTIDYQEDSEDIRLKVEVIDTGIGIRKEDMDQLFLAFKRLDEQKNHGVEGTGLGINIVREFLKMLGSELMIESEYGKGSDFYFIIEQKVMDRKPVGDMKKILMGSGFAKGETYLYAPDAKVLVTDDNELNLKVIKSLFKRSRITVDLASSGNQAIELLQSNHYDIVFLDHMMPKKDGIQTLHEIKDRGLTDSTTPIIVLTANAISGARESYINEGFNDYLSKPIASSELEAMLRTYLPEHMVSFKESEQKELRKTGNSVEAGSQEASAMVQQVSHSDEGASVTNELGLVIPGIDVNKGLLFMQNDEESYFSVLKDFCLNCSQKLDLLDEYLRCENFKDYKIEVHAMKSNCFTLGADETGELAKTLEKAALEEDRATIDSLHPSLRSKIGVLSEHIRYALEERGITIGFAAEGAKGALLKALDDFDSELAVQIIDQIESGTEAYNEDILLVVKKLVDDFDFFEALEQAKKL